MTQEPAVPREVSTAANSIGYAMGKAGNLHFPENLAIAAAQRLYDQGLLKTLPEPSEDPA